ncbi:MAG: AraC family transcriptional regulator [Verrucomicrobiota bacterium JB023]|nr:AraC family transcriptional regulator [Verrucomicrobiota bacterium JB023]
MKLQHVRHDDGSSQDWRKLLAWDSLHLILNHQGQGLVIGPNVRLTLIPGTLAHFSLGAEAAMLSATRLPDSGNHEFLIVTIDHTGMDRLFPGKNPVLAKEELSSLRRWTERDRQLYQDLVTPPLPEPAHATWRTAKLLELLTLHFFHPRSAEPLFCAQLKERSHRHVRRALELLDARISEPLDLHDLAEDVGCAPHYLSRLVKQETGKTLSLHLRAFRVQRASELLAKNQFNVTEVALEVGYHSLSHFSKAFSAERGLTPSQFLRRTEGNLAHRNGN